MTDAAGRDAQPAGASEPGLSLGVPAQDRDGLSAEHVSGGGADSRPPAASSIPALHRSVTPSEMARIASRNIGEPITAVVARMALDYLASKGRAAHFTGNYRDGEPVFILAGRAYARNN